MVRDIHLEARYGHYALHAGDVCLRGANAIDRVQTQSSEHESLIYFSLIHHGKFQRSNTGCMARGEVQLQRRVSEFYRVAVLDYQIPLERRKDALFATRTRVATLLVHFPIARGHA